MADRSITYKHGQVKTKDLGRCDLVPVWSQLVDLSAFRPTSDPVVCREERHMHRARARSFPPFLKSSPFRETGDEDKSFPYTYKITRTPTSYSNPSVIVSVEPP